MVSYPDDSIETRSLSLRRPPSVASSRTSTVRRHHRHGRSQQGGNSSNQAQNEFPWFTHTGDVEILVASGRGEQRYLLHRLILSQCSGFFEAGTSEEWSRSGDQAGQNTLQQARRGGSTGESSNGPGAMVLSKKWRYELDRGSGEDDIPMLVQRDSSSLFGGDSHAPRPPPVRNKPNLATQTNGGFFRSMANFSALNINSSQTSSDPTHSAEDDICRSYDNLFRIFYNYPPALDPTNIANAYVECKSLLQLADMYDALEVIGPRVDHHLLRFQGRLWKQIAKYPPSYLKLGYLARSRAIFSEALIHVVGQWPSGANQLRGQIPQAVIELIEDKADELEELKSRIEGKLFRLTLTTSRGERVTPANSWLDWMAMSLFRQWLAENTTPLPAPILKEPTNNRTSSRIGTSSLTLTLSRHQSASSRPSRQPAPPPQPAQPINTGRIFRLLGTGGSAYLGHDEVKKFLKINPEFYTRDNMRRFERRMEELKNLARDAVMPLMRNFLELDLGREGGLAYLTCTRVGEGDLPWEE